MPMQNIDQIKFPFEPQQKFHKIFEDIENINQSPQIIDRKLKIKGMNLYDELFPEKLKKLYWDKKDKIKSIRVLSREPWIPWEIIKPWRKLGDGSTEEDEFLCEKYSFSRWFFNITENSKEHLKNIKIIVPKYTTLVGAIKERDWLKEFFENKGLYTSFDSTTEQLFNTLKTGDYDILHFSTHGKYDKDNPLTSCLQLEKGFLFNPEDIIGEWMNFGKTNPMIILNACQTGNQEFSLTGVQGWATKFIDAGASTFIGTLWSLSDDIAFEFVKEVYIQLSNNTSLGEAIRLARNKCKREGDPSWLAYQLYGHPNAEIKIGN
jgi:hypothetical protein